MLNVKKVGSCLLLCGIIGVFSFTTASACSSAANQQVICLSNDSAPSKIINSESRSSNENNNKTKEDKNKNNKNGDKGQKKSDEEQNESAERQEQNVESVEPSENESETKSDVSNSESELAGHEGSAEAPHVDSLNYLKTGVFAALIAVLAFWLRKMVLSRKV